MVECISNFDNILSEHIARIQSAQHRMPHYLGHNIQNELIDVISEKIKTTIINLLRVKILFCNSRLHTRYLTQGTTYCYGKVCLF